MDTEPRWPWLAAAIVSLILLVSILLIALGAFDPQPFGQLVWQSELETHKIAAESRQITWLERSTPDVAYSVRLTAAYQGGERDVGYGLVVGDDDRHLVIALSPLGYAAVALVTSSASDEQDNGSSLEILPWQTWPHVNTDDGANEIWLDVQNEHLTIRVNREILWQGNAALPAGQFGIVGESFGENALVEYRRIQLFAE